MNNKRRLNKKNFVIFLGIVFIALFLFAQLISVIPAKTRSQVNPVLNNQNTTQQNIEKRTIVLDPGHGGYDDGAIAYNGYKEKEITLSIADKIRDYLAYYNVEVVMTRESDEVSWSNDNVEDLRARSMIANTSNAEYFVSIHCNSAELQDEAKGSEIYVYFDQEDSYSLAHTINEELKQITSLENREMKDAAKSPLQLLMENQIPSCIIEMGFLTDQKDADFLISEDGQNLLTMAISKGILTTLGIQI